MRRRHHKSSPLKTILLWALCLTLVGWGLYQADQLRRSLPTSESAPNLALSATTVPAPDVQGDEPGSTPTLTTDTPLLPPPPDEAIPDLSLPGETQNTREGNITKYPETDPALSAEELSAQGTQLLNSGQIVPARFALNAALARATDDARAQPLRDTLSALNTPVFLGNAILPDDPAARLVEIQPDDTFLTLGRAYGIPAAFLQTLNPPLNPKNLKPGTGIKIVQGPFHARIIKHANRLDLYARDLYVTSLPVDFPEGNYLPKGNYQISAGTKLQLSPPPSPRTWIGFQGLDSDTESVTNGWLFASAGPRGNTPKDRATGIHLDDAALQTLFSTLTESRSHLRVEP